MQAAGLSEHIVNEARADLKARHAQRTVAVWPEHWHALQIFLAMSTQWCYVQGQQVRRVGLNYAVLPVVRQAVRVPRAYHQRWRYVFQQIQVLEVAALNAMNKAE